MSLIIYIIIGVIVLFCGLILYITLYADKDKTCSPNSKYLNLYADFYTLKWYENQQNIVLKCIDEDCNYETEVDYPIFEKMYNLEKPNFEDQEIVYFECPNCRKRKVIPLDFYRNSNYFKFKKFETKSCKSKKL